MKKLLAIIAFVLVASVPNLYSQSKHYSDYNLRRAAELIESSEVEEAKRLVDGHIEEYPDDAYAYLLKAVILRAEENLSSAL